MTQRAESSCPRTGRFHAQNRERRFHAQNRERETPGARLGTRSMGPRRPAPGAHESLIKRRLPPAPGRRASPAARAAPPWCGLSRPSPCPPPPRALQATGRSAAPPAPRQCRAQCRCAQSTGRRRFGARGPGGGAGRLQHACGVAQQERNERAVFKVEVVGRLQEATRQHRRPARRRLRRSLPAPRVGAPRPAAPRRCKVRGARGAARGAAPPRRTRGRPRRAAAPGRARPPPPLRPLQQHRARRGRGRDAARLPRRAARLSADAAAEGEAAGQGGDLQRSRRAAATPPRGGRGATLPAARRGATTARSRRARRGGRPSWARRAQAPPRTSAWRCRSGPSSRCQPRSP